MEKIDFVIPWVDGSDPNWIKEKNKYMPNIEENNDASTNRYRDWEILKYWFRTVEKYASWVNKIYFITWGHIPEWLDTSNPKLVIVNHKDYIPKEYLPTFSSHTIELNIHRINGLSENFVYFNDDMFIVNDVKKDDFFKNDIPCDSAVFSPYIPKKYNELNIICWNMIGIINSHFSKNEIFKKNINKFVNVKYGKMNLRTIYMNVFPYFTGFYEFHIPYSYKKSTLNEVWKEEFDVLNMTSIEKFRNVKTHVNQWVFRYWQLASGNFIPRRTSFGKYFSLLDDFDDACKCILNPRKTKVICLNDSEDIVDFDEKKEKIIAAFEKKLPDKCSFEK